MSPKTKTQEEMEQPVRVWELRMVEDRINQQEKLNRNIDAKLTTILEKQITAEQFEQRVASITTTFAERMKAQSDGLEAKIREVDMRYAPLADTVKWGGRGLAMLLLAQLVAFLFNILGRK